MFSKKKPKIKKPVLSKAVELSDLRKHAPMVTKQVKAAENLLNEKKEQKLSDLKTETVILKKENAILNAETKDVVKRELIVNLDSDKEFKNEVKVNSEMGILIHQAIKNNDRLMLLSLLLKAPDSLEFKDESGDTPLYHAFEIYSETEPNENEKITDIIKILLNQGADITVTNQKTLENIFHLMCGKTITQNDVGILDLILETKMDNQQQLQLRQSLLSNANKNREKHLFYLCDPSTPLDLLISNYNEATWDRYHQEFLISFFKLCIKVSLDLNTKNKYKETFMMSAIQFNAVPIVESLFDYGISFFAKKNLNYGEYADHWGNYILANRIKHRMLKQKMLEHKTSFMMGLHTRLGADSKMFAVRKADPQHFSTHPFKMIFDISGDDLICENFKIGIPITEGIKDTLIFPAAEKACIDACNSFENSYSLEEKSVSPDFLPVLRVFIMIFYRFAINGTSDRLRFPCVDANIDNEIYSNPNFNLFISQLKALNDKCCLAAYKLDLGEGSLPDVILQVSTGLKEIIENKAYEEFKNFRDCNCPLGKYCFHMIFAKAIEEPGLPLMRAGQLFPFLKQLSTSLSDILRVIFPDELEETIQPRM